MDTKELTVKEAADQLGCTVRTVRKHIQRCFPDLMLHGKTTRLTEAQATVILESMKQSNKSFQNRTGNARVPSAETSTTDELRLAMIYKQDAELMKEAASLERKMRIKTEMELHNTRAALGQEIVSHQRTKNGLAMYQRIAEANGMVRSDRDDLLDTYRR
jgi:DNA-binding transcriptional MerR regulator